MRRGRAAGAFYAYGARLVVTLGADGVFASLDGEHLRAPAPQVDVVDSVGGGDSFMAGFLHSLHAAGALGGRLGSLDAERAAAALHFGARVAAAVCAVRGANPPWAGGTVTVLLTKTWLHGAAWSQVESRMSRGHLSSP